MKKVYILLFSAAILTNISCNKNDGCDPPIAPDANAQVVENYSNIVFATYEDSWTAAKNLKAAAADFVATPSAAGLETVRAAYIAARTPYIQSEAFRFYDGPIDDARGIEGLLNSWPLDESYMTARPRWHNLHRACHAQSLNSEVNMLLAVACVDRDVIARSESLPLGQLDSNKPCRSAWRFFGKIP